MDTISTLPPDMIYAGMAIIVIICIFLLIALRKWTLGRYKKYFHEIQSIIRGKYRNSLFSMIEMDGRYRNRDVHVSFYTRGTATRSDFPSIKIKPHKSLPQPLFCIDHPHPTKDTNLNRGWLEKVCSIQEIEKRDAATTILDYLSDICEKIEREEITIKT